MTIADSGGQRLASADELGRVGLLLFTREKSTIEFQAPGFRTEKREYTCAYPDDEIMQEITLAPAAATP